MNGEKKKYQALILVAGVGTRLRPHTETVPKPMVEIDGRPFLEFKIESLKKHGITDFILCVGHLGHIVEEHFGDGKRFGLNIKYSYENNELLGTAGAIKNAEHLIESDFIATNGDTFLDVDVEKLIETHETNQSKFTMVVAPATHPKTQELVEVNENKISKLHKRETIDHEQHLITTKYPFVNGGLYVMNKSILDPIPSNQKISLEQEIFPQLIGTINAFVHQGYMLDVADEGDWSEFQKDVRAGLIIPSISGHKKVVRSRAPVRITFGGGGTDLHPYDSEHGGVCLNATINRYVYSTLRLRDDKKINIKSDIVNNYGGFETLTQSFKNIDELTSDEPLRIIKETILEMNPRHGFDLYVRSDVPPKSGLGASASLCVSIIGVLNHLRKKNRLTKYEIAETAFRIEDERLENTGGRQDQYATVFGGITLQEYNGKDNVKVHNIDAKKDQILELEKNLLILSSPRSVSSSGEAHDKGPNLVNEDERLKRLHNLKEIAKDMEFNLRRGNLKKFGKLIMEGWENKKKFNPSSTDMYIDALVEEALANGAIGVRLIGAGGAGNLLIFSEQDKEHKIKEVLSEKGLKSIDFSFDFDGLSIWEVDE
jgi:D-glycero-alpha-D-manno-heptose-7-phosphate kinase